MESKDAGVGGCSEVDDAKTRCFRDDAVVPVEAAFVEDVELRLAEHRKDTQASRGEGCFH